MSAAEIDTTLIAYLTLRRKQHFPLFHFVLHDWFWSHNRPHLENFLSLDLKRLYARARVRPMPVDKKHVLFVYVGFPKRTAAYVVPPGHERFAELARQVAMPPLEGLTTGNVEMMLRSAPTLRDADIVAEQDGDVVRVRVLAKREAEGESWRLIELLEPMRVKSRLGDFETLDPGEQYWIEKSGIDPVIASWDLFLSQVIVFESSAQSLAVHERLTMLRQQTHPQFFINNPAYQLGLDNVIVSNSGALYLNTVADDPTSWQIGKDYDAFRAPDGRVVDIQHVLASVDVLNRREQDVEIVGLLLAPNMYLGKNWAAALWAGDVGSAAADMEMRLDTNWEDRNKDNQQLTKADRAKYYFEARAADRDLLGDLDGWGMAGKPYDSLEAMLTAYYTDTADAPVGPVVIGRARALEAFLEHYQFERVPASDLTARATIRSIVAESAIQSFATAFLRGRRAKTRGKQYKAARSSPPDAETLKLMNDQFLDWLEVQLIENEVPSPEEPETAEP
jgi:hypothetical protein